MILFVGAEDRGYFVKEEAAMREEELVFLEESPVISAQLNRILEYPCAYLMFDLEQYVDGANELAEEIKRIERAKNCEILIYAPGYSRQSRIVEALMEQGIKYFIHSANPGEAKEELARCLLGYYKESIQEEVEDTKKQAERETKNGLRIGITGACGRIGTTTFGIQFVKYLQLKGHRACYIEVNQTGFVQKHEASFHTEHDASLGKVTFEHVDLYYKQENLLEVWRQGYDYYVYDFGTYTDSGFNKTSFLEKDIRIFVAGSKASEMEYTMDVLRNEFYTDVYYVFNFISEREKADLLEFMEEKAGKTHFTVYTPDQFEYVHNPVFEKILPVKDMGEREDTKNWRGLFKRNKRKQKKQDSEGGTNG